MAKRKAFRPESRIYELVFPDDHELAGLVVRAKALKWGDYLKLGSLIDIAKSAPSDQFTAVEQLHQRFGKTLVEWNHAAEDSTEEDEKLLPANAEGLAELEDWEFFALLDAYMDAAVGVPDPLPNSSNSGGRSLGQLPMTEA